MSATDDVQHPVGQHQHRPRYKLTRRGKIVFTGLPVLILIVIWLTASGGGSLTVEGVEPDSVLTDSSVAATVSVSDEVDPEALSATLDDRPLSPTAESSQTFRITADEVPDGEHSLTVVVERGFPFGAIEQTVDFTIDTTPPTLQVLSPTEPVGLNDEVVVEVEVDEPGARVAIDGEQVEPSEEGRASRTYAEPPDGAVLITATDEFGNESQERVDIQLALPGAPGAPPMVGVHATGWTWATPELKDPIMQMVDDGLINTVQLDLKDEAGDIWYDTEVELAHEAGAVTELWDLSEQVEELHAKGVRVIGRIVNFRDPRLATHAVDTGNMEWVIQNPDGTAYGQYGGFTNFFNDEVREYNIALAEEAARLGVDDIMFDYVRRPDTLNELVYPGQEGEPEDGIVSFLSDAYDRVRDNGARLSAAVFGIAATRPQEIAQDIPRMAEEVDYIAPMVYPSHWGPGEYGVENPNAQPYDITYRSIEEFVELTEGTNSHIVSWLQDFSLGVDYGEAEVRAQIEASRDAGVDHILLWDAATTYTRAALDPIEG